jgi:hypothetical protein
MEAANIWKPQASVSRPKLKKRLRMPLSGPEDAARSYDGVRSHKNIDRRREEAMVFSYRDMLVTPSAIRQGDAFGALAQVRDLDGRERSVHLPGEFACVEEAVRFAITEAFEYIDVEQHCHAR